MKKINCIGDYCPIPLLKVMQELNKKNPPEQLLIVTDHSCVLESIREYLTQKAYPHSITEVINGVWEICIIVAG